MSRKIDLFIMQSGELLDGPLTDRPVRRRPDGVAGAVYRGMVYPLQVGGVIDLDDEPCAKSECGFVQWDEAIPYATVADVRSSILASKFLLDGQWTIETNSYGHYLVFDGLEEQRSEVVRALLAAGIGVRRQGASVRAAFDGYHYDHFVRLDFDGTSEECLAAITQALTVLSPDQTGHPLPVRPSIEAPNVERLLADKDFELSVLKEQLNQQQASAALRVQVLERLLAAAKSERDEWAAHFQDLQPSGLLRAGDRLAEEKIAALEAELAALQQDHESFVTYANELERDAALHLQTEVEARRAHERRAEALNTELQALRALGADRRVGRVTGDAEGILKDLLHATFPRLGFDDDSYNEILVRFPRRAPLFEALRKLDQNDDLPVHVLSGYPTVRKVNVHIQTGDPSASNMGRIYLREGLPGKAFTVFVRCKTDKAEQNRTIRNIASVDLTIACGFDE